MRISIFATLFLAWGSTASALSCMFMEVEGLYTNAAEAAEAYVPVVGRLSGVSMTPKPGGTVAEPVGSVGSATFQGHYVDSAGALKPWRTAIAAETFCLASWCGGVPDGTTFLGFLRADGGAYRFEGNACPNVIFNPSPDQIARLQACMQGADCMPDF